VLYDVALCYAVDKAWCGGGWFGCMLELGVVDGWYVYVNKKNKIINNKRQGIWWVWGYIIILL